MATANTSASTATVIRPEFQLCQITNPAGFLNKQTGIFMPAGTIYARLFFPAGCTEIGSTVKGKIAYDSRLVRDGEGWVRRSGHKQFELHIICRDVAQYRKLYITCGKSNILFNRKRTDNLMRDLNNNGIGSRSAIVYTFSTPIVTPVATPVVEIVPPVTSIVVAPVVEVTPAPVIDVEAVAIPTHLESTPDAAAQPTSTPTSTELEFIKKYAPRSLRRLCKHFGIIYSHVPTEKLKSYTYDQLVTRGITADSVKAVFRNSSF